MSLAGRLISPAGLKYRALPSEGGDAAIGSVVKSACRGKAVRSMRRIERRRDDRKAASGRALHESATGMPAQRTPGSSQCPDRSTLNPLDLTEGDVPNEFDSNLCKANDSTRQTDSKWAGTAVARVTSRAGSHTEEKVDAGGRRGVFPLRRQLGRCFRRKGTGGGHTSRGLEDG